MLIELDKSLTAGSIRPDHGFAGLQRSIAGSDQIKVVAKNLPNEGVFHLNYLNYLNVCYDEHLTPIVSPDLIWNLVLSELATVVKQDPESYRDIFTTSNEKQEIVVLSNSPDTISVALLINAMKDKVPTSIDTFIPEFEDALIGSTDAMKANFLDMASPYYNYGMMMCGFPSVMVRGTIGDWGLLILTLNEIFPLFEAHAMYLAKVKNIANSILRSFTTDDSETLDFWKDMFSLKHCGSGHQTKLNGWVRDLFIETPEPAYVSNFPTSVAKLHYKNLDTDKEYDMYYGLFSSVVMDGNILLPQYNYIVAESGESK